MNKSKVTSFLIRAVVEEQECQLCGWPLYIGDTVYQYDDDPDTASCCPDHAMEMAWKNENN